MLIVKRTKKIFGSLAMLSVMAFVPVLGAAAQQTLSSPNYTIDASVGDSFGGTSSSTNYGLVSSGGEAVAGDTSSTSYSLGEGYVAQLEGSTSGVTGTMQVNFHTNSLQHFYALDSTTGTTAYDVSENGQDMTLNNGPVWTTGKIDGALQFDGSNDYAVKTTPIGGNSPSGIAVSAWFNPGRLNVKQAIFTHAEDIDGASPDGYQLGIGSDNKPYFTACNGTTCATSTVNTTVSTGTWYKLTGRVTGSSPYTVTARLNTTGGSGVALNNVISYGTNRAFSAGAQVNYGAATTNYFQGSIDQISYFSNFLHPDAVDNYYAAENSGISGSQTWRNLTPGVSSTNETEWIVRTDAAGGYTVGIEQDHDLQWSTYSIPAISTGTIGTPALWTEGTTEGVGFTLEASPGSPVSPDTGVWGSGASLKYAAIPNTLTTFYTKNTAQTSEEWMDLLIRISPPFSAGASVSGATEEYYSNTVTLTGTALP